MVRRP
jgi:hypothetical protein